MASTRKGERGLKAAAVAYAKRGWRVLPLQPGAKRPLTALVPHGVKNATTDLGVIAGWWAARPDANIGVATGSVSGIVVVDIDGEEGEQALAARSDGPLPLTLTAQTSRGRHLYFALRNGAHAACARLAPGFDLKGDGGYVVAPPSLHPCGERYRWENGATSPAPLMAWLLRNGEAEEKAQAHVGPDPTRLDDLRVSARIKKLIREGAPKGQRSEPLFGVIRAMVKAGHSNDEIISALTNLAHGISAKAREQGPAWLAGEIKRAREKPDQGDGAAPGDGGAGGAGASASQPGESPPPPPRFRLYGLGDLRDLPRRKPLVEGLIDRETLATLIGPPESGKSAIALNLAVSIAAGRPFAGRPVEQGPVVYLAAEGQQGLRGRLEALCKRLGVELSNNVPFRLLPLDADLRTIEADVRGVISSVKGWLGNTRPALLITDTLSATFGAGEENASSDMMAYVRNVRRIMSELRSAALLLHHVPQHAQGKLEPRGHSSLKGNCETILATSKRPDGTVSLETRKEKDMAKEGSILFKLEGVELDPLHDGEPQQAVCALALDDTPAMRAGRLKGHAKTAFEVLRRLTEESRKAGQNGDVRLARWEEAFCASVRKHGQAPDTSRRAFGRARKKLEDQGIVRVSGDTVRLAS